jgi:hypothetical protein
MPEKRLNIAVIIDADGGRKQVRGGLADGETLRVTAMSRHEICWTVGAVFGGYLVSVMKAIRQREPHLSADEPRQRFDQFCAKFREGVAQATLAIGSGAGAADSCEDFPPRPP